MARFAAGGLLIRGDRVLLGRRSRTREVFPGLWDVPGGRSEDGEAPAETMRRELGEELGIVPTEYDELAILPAADERLPFHLYRVRAWRGWPRNLQPEEHTEIAWVALGEIAALDLAVPSYPTLFAALRS